MYVLDTDFFESVDLQFQVSNDLENWSNPSTSSPWRQTVGTRGYTLLTKITSIDSSYLRVQYDMGVAGTEAICSLTLNLSEQ